MYMTMVMGEDQRIVQQISRLEDEHKSLDALLANEKSLDQLNLQRLKKRKLWIKDQISQLYDVLHPDIIA